MSIALTELVACAGCASKLAAGELARVLHDLPPQTDPNVLVDFRGSDDAGIYRWPGGPALVQTVDFFTPIVDDPFTYGQIAAANALSDVYAMGGVPVTALAIARCQRRASTATRSGRSSSGASTSCRKPARHCSAATRCAIRK